MPKTGQKVGPGSKTPVFYNPAMVSNRDVSILYAKCRAKRNWRMLDGLAGTGARGVRLAVEAPGMRIAMNERSHKAHEVILRNIDLNGLKGLETSNRDLFELLPGGKWDWLDIDPYGSPINFVDQAARRLSERGVLSVSATDTAPLCGTFAKACKRRYMAKPLNTGCRHDTGLRILAGSIIRRAAVMDIALTPELAYYQGHFFRIYFRKTGSAKKADTNLGKIGYLRFENGEYEATACCPDGKNWAGPLWLGNLFERGLVREMLEKADDSFVKSTHKLLGIMKEELLQPPYHYHTDDIARLLKIEPPRTALAVDSLKGNGFRASAVHYDPKGFRTDANISDLKRIFG